MSGKRYLLGIVIGWYFAMAYPKDNSIEQIMVSLFIGTLGIVVVAASAYLLGRETSRP